MNHQDTLVKATINSFMLQSIAGLFLRSTKTLPSSSPTPNVDPEDLDYMQLVADGVAHQVLFQSKMQSAPFEESDCEEDGIDMQFECPIFVVMMICTVLRAAADVLSGAHLREIHELTAAWVPMAKAALRVSLDTEGDREAFNASWEASE